MPARSYRHSGNHIPIATASGTIAAGALVYQEGFLGFAITGAATGASLQIETQGVHKCKSTSGTAKGDRLYADLYAGESVDITLSKTASNNSLVAIAVGDLDADGYALVLMAAQPFAVEAS